VPGPVAELGLGAVLTAAELKLRASLPPELGARAGRIRERFHLDAPAWFRRDEHTPHLSALAGAVWDERLVQARYLRWKAPREVTRTLAPLGVVLKAGRWYLVAAPADDLDRPLTYRVSNVLGVDVLEQPFTRPGGFDLAEFWQAWAKRYEQSVYVAEAAVRMTVEALGRMPHIFPPAMSRGAVANAGPPGDDGWLHTTVPIESVTHGLMELLKLGADVEVLGPPELRARFAETSRAMSRVYLEDES
jgi:predicted DNA-binding transcriptional regulator YafY